MDNQGGKVKICEDKTEGKVLGLLRGEGVLGKVGQVGQVRLWEN